MTEVKAEVRIDNTKVVSRVSEFIGELKQLADKYEVELGTATNDENGDNYLTINLKEFIKRNDIEMKIRK